MFNTSDEAGSLYCKNHPVRCEGFRVGAVAAAITRTVSESGKQAVRSSHLLQENSKGVAPLRQCPRADP